MLGPSSALAALGALSVVLDSTPLPPLRELDPEGARPAVSRVWFPHEFVYRTGERDGRGDALHEAGGEPFNPWLNWRFSARFEGPSGQVHVVPGFYAGDAAGRGVGDVWKVRFAPDEAGAWLLVPRFEYASTPLNVESLDVPGERAIPLETRVFTVAPADPLAPGFLARGPLCYSGQHYLTFPDGTPWLEGGTDSPENFFGYAGFDDTEDAGGTPTGQSFLHEFAPHVGDWSPGDPDWEANGDPHAGRGIIGALNYLASQGVNSIYLLPNNLGGDGWDTYPFLDPDGGYESNTHWDASRMEQWDTVLEHAMRLGIAVQFVLAEQETESVAWLGSPFGVERKLFFKNLVAMFGHHPALELNLCEENSAEPTDEFTVAELTAFAKYLSTWDAYGHPLTVHSNSDTLELYEQVLGSGARWLTNVSLQLHDDYGLQVEEARELADLNDGQPLVVDQDEQGTSAIGLSDENAAERRKEVLYDVYLSGGNLAWYLGVQGLPVGGDVDLEDFRTREEMWGYMRHARALLARFPWWRMQPDDRLVQGEGVSAVYGGAEVLAERGSSYLVYYPDASVPGTLNLTHVAPGESLAGSWFDPRTGTEEGPRYDVPTGLPFAVPLPPFAASEDWVLVVRAP